jgi:Anti-sigma-K factor rskA
VSHTDLTILALRALGENAGTAADDEHAGTCAQCRAEQARLAEIVSVARAEGPAPLETPPPQVWDRIAAAVADGPPSASTVADGPPSASAVPVRSAAANGSRTHRAVRRNRLATALAGLAAGLVIGIGGTIGVVQLTKAPATRVVAQIQLSPLPQFPQWRGASGTAVMRSSASQQVIAVTLDAPPRQGFYEVWLLARNGVSMISLGELNANHTGTFTIPPGTDLRNYSRIDVSLQPFNGITVHAKTSVVRGSLPAAALGAAHD